MSGRRALLFCVLFVFAFVEGHVGRARAEQVFMTPETFLSESFGDAIPAPSFLWLKADVKEAAREILDRDLRGLRTRYWRNEAQTVWMLDEIGKTQPISVGISVRGGAIDRLQVLVYRESHGWEVRYPFFTDQFKGMKLADGFALSEQVDGISGATLSVRALTKLARLALFYDGHVRAEAQSGE